MARISFVEAVSAGPRLVRRQPSAVAVWVLFQLGVGVLSSLALVAFAGETLTKMTRIPKGDAPQILAMMGQLLPIYGVLLAVSAVSSAISVTAVYRAVLRPQDGGIAFMKLGADEARQLAVLLIWAVIGFAVYIGAAIVAGIFAGVLGAVNAAIPGVTTTTIVIAILLVFMAGFLIIAAPRFSLAMAQTFDMRRVMPFSSWSLTRGHYWTLLAVWVATVAAIAAIYGVIVGVGGLANMALGPRHVFSLNETGDMSSLGAYLTPRVMLRLLVGGLGLGLLWPLTLAPFAAAYRAVAPVHGSGVVGERVAEVFS